MLDAMDMLHLNSTIDAFAIVSSDSDFTPLAQRLREAGKVVVGFVEKKTPASFMAACVRFIYTENLLPCTQAGPITTEALSSEQNALQSIDDDTIALLRRAIDDSARDDGWSDLGQTGLLLHGRQSKFDVRSYGCKTLGALLQAHPALFKIKKRNKTEPKMYVQCVKVDVRGNPVSDQIAR